MALSKPDRMVTRSQTKAAHSVDTEAIDQGSRRSPISKDSNGDRFLNAHEPRHIVAIDYGTATYSACYTNRVPGADVDPDRIETIRFGPLAKKVDTVVAAWHDGSFFFGDELIAKSGRGAHVPMDKHIKQWKLRLYDRHCTSAQAHRAAMQLERAGHDLHDLLTESLRHIWNQIQAWFQSAKNGRTLRREDTLLYLPVPILANVDTMVQMARAARVAQLPRVKFVFEPLCIGPSILRAVVGRAHTREDFEPYQGTVVLILDMGGGTTDCVSVRLGDSYESTLRNRLQIVGQPDGDLCGSTTIDHAVCHRIVSEINRRDPGGMQKICNKLKMSAHEVLNRAMIEFESKKESFPRLSPKVDMTVYGGTSPQSERHRLEIDLEALTGIFEEVIARIGRLGIKNAKASGASHVVLSGGLAQSRYVWQRLVEIFKPHGITVTTPEFDWLAAPVAAGALLVESKLDQSNVRARHSVGLVMDNEPFNPRQHSDAYNPDGTLNPAVLKLEKWQNIEVVEDRIRWLLRKGAKASSNGEFLKAKKPELQVFVIPEDEPVMSFTVVFTTNDGVRNHQALNEKDGTRKPGLSTYTEKMTLSREYIARLKKCGWAKTLAWPDPNARNRTQLRNTLEVYCLFSLRYTNNYIEVLKQLAKPEAVEHSTKRYWYRLAKFSYDPAQWENAWDADYDIEVVDTSVPSDQNGGSHIEQSPPDSPASTIEVATSAVRQARAAQAESSRNASMTQPQHFQVPHGLPLAPTTSRGSSLDAAARLSQYFRTPPEETWVERGVEQGYPGSKRAGKRPRLGHDPLGDMESNSLGPAPGDWERVRYQCPNLGFTGNEEDAEWDGNRIHYEC